LLVGIGFSVFSEWGKRNPEEKMKVHHLLRAFATNWKTA
jgi:hypothetical protein